MDTEDDFEEELSEDEHAAADDTAEVSCPYCGELVEIALDAGGGAVQHYVEDCQVCCRPMRINVRYGRGGEASATATAEDEEDME
jgi:cysteine-rich CPXCG protein